MRVTDTQVHIWEADRPDRPWQKMREPGLAEPFTAEMLLAEMEKADVDRVVLVPPSHTGYITPNDYALESARNHPDRFGVMGRINPTRPDAGKLIAEWMSDPGMKGIRMALRREPEAGWIRDGGADWLWPEAEKLGIPIAIQACGQLQLLPPIVERHPDLTLIIDHVGCPAPGPDPFRDWEFVMSMAKCPNVVIKLSGLTRFTEEKYPFPSLHPYIRRAYDVYGPHRLAWGSDYTNLVGKQAYREAVDLVREACDFLSTEDREWILDKTIARALRWE